MLVSTIISGISSRPTQAESLLYQVTCRVVGLLGVQCETTPASTPVSQQTSPSGSGSSKPANSPGGSATPTATSNSSTAPSGTSSFTPVNVPDQSLPSITPITNTESSSTRPQNSVTYDFPSSVGGEEGDVAVLGATTQIPLRSSPEGWKLFGITWYWWLLAITAIVALGNLGIKRHQTRRLIDGHS